MRHHTRPAALMLLLACLALGPAVLADDIVHFQNGTFMKVQGYTLEGDTIKVSLGPGASMSFPKNLVESIERSGLTVWPQASSGPANVVVSGGAGGTGTSSQSLEQGLEQVTLRHRPAAGGTGEGTAADKDAAATRPDPHIYQSEGSRSPIRAVGRRSGPIGEGLVDKDPRAQPPTIQKPRVYATLLPKGKSSTESEPEVTPPVAPPPAAEEPPLEDPVDEEDGGN